MAKKNSTLDNLRKVAERTAGAGVCSAISEQPPLSVLSSGVLSLDHALGVGGWSRGGMHMLYGNPRSGKTALTLLALGDKMRRNPDSVAVWLDVEKTLRVEWVSQFGIDPDRLLMLYPATTEETVNLFQDALRSGGIDFVVVDSLGAMARASELDGKDGDGGDASVSTFGGSAGLISRLVRVGNGELMRMFRAKMSGEDVLEPSVLFINQARVDIGAKYDGAIKFTGGKALEHMLSSIVRVQASGKREEMLMGTDTTGKLVQVGSLVNVRVEKNKNAPSPRQASYYFCYQQCEEHDFGVDTLRSVIDLSEVYGLVEKNGGWYKYGEEKFNGGRAFAAWLRENQQVQDSLRNSVLEIVRGELVADIAIVDEANL